MDNYKPAMWEIVIEEGTEYADPIVCKTKEEAEEMQRRTDYSTGVRPLFYKPTMTDAIWAALYECEAYFDDRADADSDQDGFIPNEEMKILTEIRAVIKGVK